MTHVTPTEAPLIWHRGKRAARTIFQALIVLVPTANLIALAVAGYLNDQTDVVVPGVVFVILNGVVVATSLIMGLAARIMAVPGVNTFLTRIGLGSVPASTIKP